MIDVSSPAALSGLTQAQAAERLAADGPNELPRHGRRSFLRICLEVLREPMLAMLLVAGLIYLALGDAREALILLVFALLSIVITVVQETRTEHALDALRDLTSPRALVIRDGKRQTIASRDVVCGDLMVLNEGDRVPADGWIARGDALECDESLLTGESVPVRKSACSLAAPTQQLRPGGDDLPFVYSGTLVVRGSGLAVVSATGAASEIGRIGQSLSTIETEAPRLQRQMRRLVWWFAALGGCASVLAVVLYGLLRGSWLNAALAGIALGMSMLPEEFPVVLTVFMAMGAMRMSRVRVLTRRATAIETLGSATVLCTDKTGTLTENRMRIAQLRSPYGGVFQRDGEGSLDTPCRLLAELGILASAPQPVDPMEIAFYELSAARPGDGLMARQGAGWALRHHYPLAPALLAMSQVWAGPNGECVIAAKGAPEAIADLCHLTDAEYANLKAAVDAMAGAGFRVLGVAEARWAESDLPATQRDFAFAYRGLVGLADPLRAAVPAAVRQCRAAGIRVVMITGDYPQTAQAIAAQAGIGGSEVLTGDALARMSETELAECIARVTVCARIMPEQKLRIVEALKASGEIVAMTGDGVNDAPSLKAANIGIAMGGRGTDVAREAAAIVLLDDDFGAIVKAVSLGRRIYDNLRKAIGFILAAHIPIAGLTLLPLLTGMPLLLGPIHIAFIEMIIDPVCSLVFEAEIAEHNAMTRPPRKTDAPLFSRGLVVWAVLQGFVVLAMSGGLATYFFRSGNDAATVRSAAFFALVLGLACLILVNRRFSASLLSALRRPNPALSIVLAIVAIILAATQMVPAVADLFSFARVSLLNLAIVLGASVMSLLGLEAIKPFVVSRLIQR
ncbi:cation-translocating P-type ATPase [Novosphingobium sp. KACC 22771]|uniref:cation-translocating P-type ATPase n=1 Tax=Novosphingobium sp. KACC 22771 TaxID=3025670 RepID=UPI0023660212|nr:cation-translocating P-type ATPase [Novosphingobium sp. KACC 22771]WDF72490.1 cation-translocating P-type ATPase [Novosphingobium sp. KACC 22771]